MSTELVVPRGKTVAAPSFSHLHVHTEYSLLDGASKMKDLVTAAYDLGQSSVAITDHGNMHGTYDLWKTAKALAKDGKPVTPIMGCELYVAPDDRYNRNRVLWGTAGTKGKAAASAAGDAKDVSGGGAYTHMTMLALNAQGLRAMFELTSRAWHEGWIKVIGKAYPRIDFNLAQEVIGKYPGAELVATTGCPSGAVQTRMRLGQIQMAAHEADRWQQLLGKGNYFLELMDHSIDLERTARAGLMQLADYMKLPLLATNDAHFVAPDDAQMHDALLCIQMGKTIAETNRLKFDGKGYHLRSSEEMRQLFAELPEACDNTLRIAERVAPDAYDEVFNYRDDLLPEFPVPDGHTEASYLRERIELRLPEAYPDPEQPGAVRADARERAEYELATIERMGYPGYMLMVAEFIAWAREQGIWVGPGRGSAAGSLVSYLLRITTVPTLEHGLLFERFINPERVSPPDVDVDFEQARRNEVFAHLAEIWGEGNVCRIATVGRMKAKEAIKDACRVLDLPFGLGAKMNAAYPDPISGFDAPLACVTDESHDRYGDADQFRAVLGKEDDAQRVFELAKKLEGTIRKMGVHACGIVVSRYPLLGRIPMMWTEKDGWISGFSNADVLEKMGYLKVDCLGLDTQDVLHRACDSIKALHGVDVVPELIRLDDPAAFRELGSGSTVGMFQVSSGGMASLLKLMQPDRFEDISAALALYRPGPMAADAHTNYALRKTGRQKVRAIHRELEQVLRDILGPTYGVIAYQEQIMSAVQAVAGYTLGRADILRKIMGKKQPQELDAARPEFFAGMKANGYSEEAAWALWNIFEPFAAYAFNIAHTVSYGYITYATAFLKANYPAEFMAALLTQAGDNRDKKALYLGECRRMRLKVLVPDVNESQADFVPTPDGQLRFGLSAVSGLGPAGVQAILAGRAERPYKSFLDFLDRVEPAGVTKPVARNKKAIQALIHAGAFDSFGHSRAALLRVYADAVDIANGEKKNAGFGQDTLFSWTDKVEFEPIVVPDVPEMDREALLYNEREALSFYVTGHPLDDLEPQLAGNRSIGLAELAASELTEGSFTLAGRLVAVEHRNAKTSGKPYAKVVLEDLDAQVEVMVFGQTYGVYRHMLVPDTNVRMRVRLSLRDEEQPPSVIADTVEELDLKLISSTWAAGTPKPVTLTISTARVNQELVATLRDIAQRYPGDRPLHMVGVAPDGTEFPYRPDWGVTPNAAFTSEIKALLGQKALTA